MKLTAKIKRRAFNSVYYPYINDNTPLQIFYGGSSSGKSTFIAQRVIVDLLRGGRNYLITRNVGRTIRTSVFNELKKNIYRYKLNPVFTINKSDVTITCANGYQAIMVGLDDVDKLKSIVPAKGVLTDIWCEEMTETTEDAYRQIIRRLRGKSRYPKRVTISFNPILKSHWIYKKWFTDVPEDSRFYRDDEKLILKTTYKDNSFLNNEEISILENETDEYWYNVYTLGEWGVLGDIIFKNWRVEDLSDRISQFDNIRNGLDFGFDPNPTAWVHIHYDKNHRKIYIFDELYETGLTNWMIYDRLKRKTKGERIIADSAEPKSIKELVSLGLNVEGAEKGPGSVNSGIRWLQENEIIIDKRCQNAINEFSTYHRKKDKYGESIAEPVKKDDHIIDATRYAMSKDMDGERVAHALFAGRRR